MKPETILQSDLLDIIFMNRNKDYGAYALRKEYNMRMQKALAVTFLFAVTLAATWYIFNHFNRRSSFSPIIVDDVHLISDPLPDLPVKTIRAVNSRHVATSKYLPIKVVPDNLADKIVENESIDKTLIDKFSQEGKLSDGSEPPPVVGGAGNEKNNAREPEHEAKVNTPFTIVESMPEFPGGADALRKFLLRNLNQPDDLEPGQKLLVKVKFVVAIDGSIGNIEILQSGGQLDIDVVKVVKKMPKWKPGRQNERLVPVWYVLPVTFIGMEE